VAPRSPDLATALLDAQVAWALEQFSAANLAEIVLRDVDDLFALAGRFTVADLLDADAVKEVLIRIAGRAAENDSVGEVVAALADAIYDLPASAEYNLGEIVEREHVEALIDLGLGLTTLQDRAMERLSESPTAGAIASSFATKIVGDFLQQNRQLAEKVPGVSSLLSLGIGAANKVRTSAVDQFLGDAASKSTQFAIKRTNSAMRDLIQDTQFKQAALEIWDLHAEEPISELRSYLSGSDLRELVGAIHAIVVDVAGTYYADALISAGVDVFFARYGAASIASLLDELGVDRDELIADAVRFSAPVLETLRASGDLDRLVRTRLAPFFASDAVAKLLA
jgi:hypothetical protein